MCLCCNTQTAKTTPNQVTMRTMTVTTTETTETLRVVVAVVDAVVDVVVDVVEAVVVVFQQARPTNDSIKLSLINFPYACYM